MKSFTFSCVQLLMAVVSLSCSTRIPDEPIAVQPAQTINWLSYDEGLAQAATLGKPIYIDFTAAWCGWCVKMDQETYADPAVAKMLNENFVPVKLDIDSERKLLVNGSLLTEHQIAKTFYQISAIPTSTFLESDGNLMTSLPGYRPANDFLPILIYMKSGHFINQQNLMPAFMTENAAYSPVFEKPKE